jgi:hypothetical protein
LKTFSLILLTLFFGGVATIGSLWALGIVDPLALWRPKAPSRPPSGIPVLVSGRAIPAYTRITREHLVDPKTGDLAIRYLSPKTIEEKELIPANKIDQIIGRVLNRDKQPTYAFTEKDFFPRETRPGVVAGIPPGKRAFVLQGEKIAGIHELKAGDRFDLLGSLPVDFEKSLAKHKGVGVEDALLANQLSGNTLPKRASVKVLVQNGMIVVPVKVRQVPLGSGAPKGGQPPTKPVQEITIAVDPREVAPLMEALAINAHIVCVARSGRPDDPGESSVTPGLIASPNLRVVETIIGGKRQQLLFPRPGEGPANAAEDDPPPEPARRTAAVQ